MTANRLVLMGVTGSGKTTLGEALRHDAGYVFLDADDLHPEANRRKMAAGEPLTDADRMPWLEAVARQLHRWMETGIAGALACSALKRSYRDLLRDQGGSFGLVYLRSTPEVSRRRLETRRGHFMPTTLVESQFATLQAPDPDEKALILEADTPISDQVAAILKTQWS